MLTLHYNITQHDSVTHTTTEMADAKMHELLYGSKELDAYVVDADGDMITFRRANKNGWEDV
jgi:hypothetical protein